jgi:hypothetical protein
MVKVVEKVKSEKYFDTEGALHIHHLMCLQHCLLMMAADITELLTHKKMIVYERAVLACETR